MSIARSRLGVIFVTIFIDLAGFGIILPILPYYAQSMGVAGLGFGALIGAFSLMQFLGTIISGRLSDRYGRRPILLGSMLLGAVGYVILAFAGTYAVLFLARMVAGLAAGNLAVAQAYIADVTPPAERSKGMGLVGAAFGLGLVMGPALGGLAGHVGGPMAAGLAAAGLNLANFVSAFLILKESLHAEHRIARRVLDVDHLVHGLRDASFRPAFIVFALIPFAFSGYVIALPLYAGDAFGWAERELGWFFTLVGVVAVTVQGYVFGKMARRTGDRLLAIAGTLGMALPIAAVPFVNTAAALYAWAFVLAFANSIASPALTGTISALAGITEQGAMLGAAQSFSALGRLSGPLLFGRLYDGVGPRSAFFAAAAAMAVAWVVSLRLPRRPVAVGAPPEVRVVAPEPPAPTAPPGRYDGR